MNLTEQKFNESTISFFFQKVNVKCDRNCQKAWGNNTRPRDLQDEFLKDEELGIAPQDPGTYEGDHAKPLSPDDFPNKWCVRECERCGMSDFGEKIELPRF